MKLRAAILVSAVIASGLLYAMLLPPFSASALAWIALIPLWVTSSPGKAGGIQVTRSKRE